ADRVRRPVSRVARAWWRGRAPVAMTRCLYDEQIRLSRVAGVPGAPSLEHTAEGVEGVGHDPVHAEVQQALHLGAVVDGPDVDGEPGAVGGPDHHRLDHGDARL